MGIIEEQYMDLALTLLTIVTTGSSRRGRAEVSFLVATVGSTFNTLLQSL